MNAKSKIFLAFQIIFMVLTFLGGILLFTGKMDNAGMSVCCGSLSVAFGALYSASKK